jgi:predicted amidohydrolase YtcJ
LIIRPLLLALLVYVLSGCSQQSPPAAPALAQGEVTVYRAAGIITMDSKHPRAEAVAVDGESILAVGDMLEIEAALDGRPYRVDDRFADKFLLPGFIEPHLHPYIAAILLPMVFITPHDWSLPDRQVKGVRGREAYLQRLTESEDDLDTDEEWLWTWGYHQLFHGELSRADLDAVSSTRPIIVWHRSFHEIYLNTAALQVLAVDETAATAHPQADLKRGHFYENGLQLLLPALIPPLMEPERYREALVTAREIIHAGGITTVGDANFGTLDIDNELGALVAAGWNSAQTPFRTFLLLDGKTLGRANGHEQVRRMVDFLPRRDLEQIKFSPRQVKLFADGAAYSQLMQMSEPYTDGHAGEWLMEPEELEAAARVYWNAGFQINVHVNGDRGLDATLDILETLQQENPRENHRFTIHHLAYARPDQAARLAQLGGMVQANPYYLWALGDKYSEVGLGPQRASHMVPLNSFLRAGVRVAFHSDFTMAPAQPLLLAWAAATRITAEGNVLGPSERLSLQEALRGITIDAAYQMGRETDSGSIEVGKRADFTVLEQDPFQQPLAALKDIPIWGTVFEGRLYPLQ